MEAVTRAGRIVGVLILMQMVGAFVVNFALEAPLFGAPGFLAAAAGHPQQIALGAILSLLTEAMWLGIAITAFSVIHQRAGVMALWLVALATVVLAAAVVETAGVMSMVSVSQSYVKASGPERAQLETVRIIVASARNWAHYLARILDGVVIFVFYATLYRLAAVPRLLAGFGLLAATLQIIGVGMPLFGRPVVFPLLAPVGLSQLVIALWLLARGLARERLGAGSTPARPQ